MEKLLKNLRYPDCQFKHSKTTFEKICLILLISGSFVFKLLKKQQKEKNNLLCSKTVLRENTFIFNSLKLWNFQLNKLWLKYKMSSVWMVQYWPYCVLVSMLNSFWQKKLQHSISLKEWKITIKNEKPIIY